MRATLSLLPITAGLFCCTLAAQQPSPKSVSKDTGNGAVYISHVTVIDPETGKEAQNGTLGEIWRFVLRTGTRLDPRVPLNVLAQLIAESPKAQVLATQIALRNIKSINEIGVFCLTEAPDCDRMWNEYADEGRGFVIAFDTALATFGQLTTPGRIGSVIYSDKVLETFLGAMETEGAATLFRKRMKYAFEREWRSLRLLSRLEHRANGVFVSAFDPASISRIILGPRCSLVAELRRLVASDHRYQHVAI
jgi:hypothetical protein